MGYRLFKLLCCPEKKDSAWKDVKEVFYNFRGDSGDLASLEQGQNSFERKFEI